MNVDSHLLLTCFLLPVFPGASLPRSLLAALRAAARRLPPPYPASARGGQIEVHTGSAVERDSGCNDRHRRSRGWRGRVVLRPKARAWAETRARVVAPMLCGPSRRSARATPAAPTAGEAALFELVRAGRIGVVVRRQHVVGEHILDLAIPGVKLAVEVDGRSHTGRQATDARRDRKPARLGWRVLRLDAELVLREPDVAVTRVRRAVGG